MKMRTHRARQRLSRLAERHGIEAGDRYKSKPTTKILVEPRLGSISIISDGPNYLAIMLKPSSATAIAIDKTKKQVTAIVVPCVRSMGGFVCLRNEIQPRTCSIPKQINSTKRMNNKNTGGNPMVQSREQPLDVFAEGNEQRPSE